MKIGWNREANSIDWKLYPVASTPATSSHSGCLFRGLNKLSCGAIPSKHLPPPILVLLPGAGFRFGSVTEERIAFLPSSLSLPRPILRVYFDEPVCFSSRHMLTNRCWFYGRIGFLLAGCLFLDWHLLRICCLASEIRSLLSKISISKQNSKYLNSISLGQLWAFHFISVFHLSFRSS